jgi:hypothetical protein
MSDEQYNWLKKCQVDEMPSWWNDKLSKCQVDKTQNVKVIDKVDSWYNVKLTKWWIDAKVS